MMLTKRESLEKCRDHWRYMADTGSRRKPDYFISEDIPEKDWPHCHCYCCEYANQFPDYCNHCPLLGFAWNDTGTSCPCMTDGSLYADWEEMWGEDISKRKNLARMMVLACDWALSEMEEA